MYLCTVKKETAAMSKKQILLINDMAGYGKVATAAMLPILSYMGIPTYNLPTTLVSNTFDYGKYRTLETTDYIKATLPVWRELGFRFDAIATGYIPSKRQADIISAYCKEQASDGTTIFVDPIMGDEGELYKGMEAAELLGTMREMVSVADLCYPNYTEACILTDNAYDPQGTTRDGARKLLDAIHALGAKSVLITSIDIDGQTSVAGYNDKTNEYFVLPYQEIPVHFPGTGDIFSAILVGHLLNGEVLKESTRKAMDAVYRLIDLNKDNEDKNCGIPLERCLNVI